MGQNDLNTGELAQRIRDEAFLQGQGYVKERCTACVERREATSVLGFAPYCSVCGGKGWRWKAPLMR